MRQERQASYSLRLWCANMQASVDSYFDLFWTSSACDLVLGWPNYDEKKECIKFHAMTY